MKPFLLLFLCLMNTLATAATPVIPVIFDGKQCFANWKISTPVDGVTRHPDGHELRFTIHQWKKGMDGWPRVNLSGEPVDLSGYSQVHVEIENPTDQWQDVCLSIHSSKERRSSAVGSLGPRARRTFILDISDGANLDPSAVNHVSVFLIHPKKDQTFILRKIEAVLNPNYVSTHEAVQERHRVIQKQVAQAAAQARDHAAIAPAQRQLARVEKELASRNPGYLTHASQLLEKAESEVSRAALTERDQPFLLWRSPLGMAMRNVTLPQFGTPSLENLHQEIALNDYKAICVNLSAAASAQSVSVEIQGDDKSLFTLKPTYLAIARDGSETADAIGLPTASLTMEVPPFETRQFIVWIDTRSGNPKPGSHTAALKIKVGNEAHTVPVSVAVADLRLPDTVPLLIYNWAYFFVSQVTVTNGLEKQAVANLRDYGLNTWVLRYGQTPVPKLDAGGRYLGLDNTERFHRVMELLKGKPEENFVIWLGFQREEVVALFEDQEVVNAYYRDLRAILDQYGVAPDRRYVTFVDEPKHDVTMKSLEWMEKVRKADPAIKFFDNGSASIGEKEARHRFLKLVDVYSPDWDFGFVAQFRDGMDAYIDQLQTEGVKNLGFYRCRMARKNHGVNIYEYYRLGFWRLARYGMGNIGFWTYNAGHGEDEWDGRPGAASGGTVVYRRDGQLLTSRRWELFREGLSDYRLLLALGGKENVLNLRQNPKLLPLAKSLLKNTDDPAAAEALYQQLLKEKP